MRAVRAPRAGPDDADLEQARALKRPRLVWTAKLHKRFVEAVEQLGLKNAVPKTIMQARARRRSPRAGARGRSEQCSLEEVSEQLAERSDCALRAHCGGERRAGRARRGAELAAAPPGGRGPAGDVTMSRCHGSR